MMSLHSIDGSELLGDRLVRKVYLDESGIGDAKKEPVAVVSAVIVPVDKTSRAVRQFLDDMIARHIPESLQPGFRFHAKDLFHGGNLRDAGVSRERRYEILEELCSIPQRFGLSIAFGYCDRIEIQNLLRQISPKKRSAKEERSDSASYAHAIAAYRCIMQVEMFMRFDADPDEYAELVFEDNTDTRSTIKRLIGLMHQQRIMASAIEEEESLLMKTGFLDAPIQPITRIDEEHLFSTKKGSRLLQIADACAYILRRKLANEEDCDRFYRHLIPCFTEGSQILLRNQSKL